LTKPEEGLVRRLGGPLAVSVGMLIAASRALGSPDVADAQDFLVGSFHGYVGALAAAGLLVWIGVVGLLAFNVLSAARAVSGGVVSVLRERRRRSLAVLATGLLILGMGLLRHQSGDYAMCCGKVDDARNTVNLIK